MKKLLSIKGFTLIEIMVVITIIGIITGFGMTNYYKSQERAYCKTAESQMNMIKKAQEMYFTKYDGYYPLAASFPSTDRDLSAINEALNLYIQANGFAYQCEFDNDDTTYTCTAERNDNPYTIQVTQTSGPSCPGGGCPCL